MSTPEGPAGSLRSGPRAECLRPAEDWGIICILGIFLCYMNRQYEL